MSREARTNSTNGYESQERTTMTTAESTLDPFEEPHPTLPSTVAVKAIPPPSLSEADAEELRKKAAETIVTLRDATGSKALEVVDSISSVGTQAQRHAGSDLELLRARVGEMMAGDGEGAAGRIANDLVDLRVALNQIDPHRVGQAGFLRRLISFAPLGQKRLLRTLEAISVRYEPVSQQVVLLETRLRDGRLMLDRDNIELRKLYEQIEAQQAVIQRNCYLGELLIEQLDELFAETEDPHKRDRLQEALFNAASRVQGLRMMD